MNFEDYLAESTDYASMRKKANAASLEANRATDATYKGGSHAKAGAAHHDARIHHNLAAVSAKKAENHPAVTYHEALADSHKDQSDIHYKEHSGENKHKGLNVMDRPGAGIKHWKAKVED